MMAALAALLLWSYQVVLTGSRLDVRATLSPGSDAELRAGDPASVSEVRVNGARVEPRRGSWRAPSCRKGCRVSYSFDLTHAGASPPQEWLLRPASGEARLSVHVVATDGQRFAAAGATADGALELSSFDLDFAGPAAFGPLQIERIPLGARTLQVALAPSGRARPGLLRFIAAQARSVADYFGQLPVDDP